MAPAHGGMAQAELTWVPGSPPKWFACPKTVAHPRMSTVFNDVTLHYAVLWVYLNNVAVHKTKLCLQPNSHIICNKLLSTNSHLTYSNNVYHNILYRVAQKRVPLCLIAHIFKIKTPY